MNIDYNANSAFPNQVVPLEEKLSLKYGSQVADAIQSEWFAQGRTNGNRYLTTFNNYHQRRLYARGEQSTQKYKDELSINGDLSYLNLDWKPVPILSKFVDILTNGISNKDYDIKAYAQDPESVKKRTDYASRLAMDMFGQDIISEVKATTGEDISKTNIPAVDLPKTIEEMELHLQLSYKQAIEIAEEEAITQVLDKNKYDLLKRRLNYDLVTLGIAAAKTNFNTSEGITLDYVDPSYMVYSYTEDPNFEDIYYVGEVKAMTIPEIKKQFPHISNEELEKVQKSYSNNNYIYGWGAYDENTVQVLYFEYKTYMDQVFKIKHTDQGLEKALEKPDTFNPPDSDNFNKVSRSVEVLFEGVKVLGTNMMLQWQMAENMTRPMADTTKVEMNYAICAPRMYKGRIESLVTKTMGFADMIQLTHLKLQQVISRMVPDGVFLDMDGLAEVDLGNGTNYNPAEALNMYFQTGSVVGRSLTQDGGMNAGKVPVQELSTSAGQAKIGSLINTYNYYVQMIRDVTGLNEARDGSLPDKDTLVGLQKIAAQQSNIATKHINNASLYLTLRLCENVSKKIVDVLNFPLTANALKNSISTFNVNTLSEISNLNLHDFGIFLDLEPDEEEKAQLEQNIQVALQSGGIDLEDAIDLRQIRNLKLANQMLKQKRRLKQERDQKAAQANMQAQAQANGQLAEQTALAETQKQQVLTDQKVQIEQAKSQFEIQRMQTEAQIKRELMAEEFNYNIQLAKSKYSSEGNKEKEIEDRKDKRARIIGTQQSQMIQQRQNDGTPIDFESTNDSLGDFGLEAFGPK
ncbi:MAG: hypothetical protein GY787_12800 [Alteromonadales bacterium]|jgi:hypothetical protein|nr:hypothetical protein [Alteromonadales bacterium]